ncbi:uncharacterized protein SPAPADRAFT_53704 [Spathaspora passalidarum NRRL Y-27907]|uniref:Thioredoxin domain-containing protein n=1 Tax=Spathaspora passalidarum (strain NRRL Y-27907 / 11-Y1) TaxID=619300 RepID=G3AH12_SPAPN|nr:uncharacterized protein SPAPADRAFT_53704 [Spathaspora passalidarum NRRL Y-27907]EGW35442.1 hypothetical protein SPAPADRAFT_53704 [Spathaspora passalidarum NRRL Y-27907]
MHFFLLCLLLWNLTVHSVSGQVSDFIIEFDDGSIVPTLERSEFSFIYFYSDTCKYCAKFNPVFDNLSVLFNNISKPDAFQVIKTNARKNKRLSELFKVQHYPTLKLLEYKTKEIFTYDANRDLTTLIEFLEAKANVKPNYDNFVSPIKTITNSTEFDKFVQTKNKKNKLVVFTGGYIPEWRDWEYPAHFYQETAQSSYARTTDFALVDIEKFTDSDIFARYEINTFPSMMYFNVKNGQFQTYHTTSHQIKPKLDDKEIVSFITGQDKLPWFKNTDELHNFNLQYLEYQGHLFQRKGMNLKQSDVSDGNLSEEEQYQILLQQIEL